MVLMPTRGIREARHVYLLALVAVCSRLKMRELWSKVGQEKEGLLKNFFILPLLLPIQVV